MTESKGKKCKENEKNSKDRTSNIGKRKKLIYALKFALTLKSGVGQDIQRYTHKRWTVEARTWDGPWQKKKTPSK